MTEKPEIFPCRLRGPVSRIEQCQSCKGRTVDAEVRYCSLKGECTVQVHQIKRAYSDELLPVCGQCPDRQDPAALPLVATIEPPPPAKPTRPAPTKKLTIGMAVYLNTPAEFEIVWGTIQHLRLVHAEVMAETEILVVDNNPTSDASKRLVNLIRNWMSHQVRYLPYTAATGTAAPRQHVFEQANGEVVLCIDPHIFLQPGGLRRLLDFAAANPDSQDLWQGPMLYDSLDPGHCVTHMDPVWREEMFGIWGSDPRGFALESPPFEIPMHGLGLFGCRRDAWLGFNEKFKGFGGEEGYIHEKFRQAGRKTLCLPFLRWLHLFREGAAPYPLTTNDKLSNYLVGWSELGKDIAEPRAHFTGRIPEDQVAVVFANLGLTDPVQAGSASPVVAPLSTAIAPPTYGGIDGEYFRVCQTASDINEHLPVIRALADKCERITEFGLGYGLTSIALLSARPKLLQSYDSSAPLVDYVTLSKLCPSTQWNIRVGNTLEVPPIDETELLVIDSLHTHDHLLAELRRHAPRVTRWIVFHDTMTFGTQGEDGQQPGLLGAISEYVTKEAKGEWKVTDVLRNNNGLLILERIAPPPAHPPYRYVDFSPSEEIGSEPVEPEKIKKTPSLFAKALNLAGAVAAHIVDGGKNVSRENFERRLRTCEGCELLQDNGTCGQCGCPVALKAKWRSEKCPHPQGNRWAEADAVGQVS
ncbi:hypothetical protein BH11PLA2_BH11PLA2_34670 [soil metagenome]